jgi:hypothetical protein
LDAHLGTDQLTADEEWLTLKLHDGESAEFHGCRNARTIRAKVVRDLLLGRTGSGKVRPRIPLTGVRIRNACIEGNLDLNDLARPGIGLPALMLEDCDLSGPINLEGSRFARLSIKGSRFSYLNMRECEIDGPFDFSGTGPYDRHDGSPLEAWIDAQGCIVNGQVTGSGARLVTPKARDATEVKESGRRYALWLANADIRGSVILLRGFSAEGGVCFRSARIRGDIWASGATLTRGEGFALNAQAARIGDLMALNDGFTAHGQVWLLATQIGARLLLDGATLHGTDDKGSTDPHRGRKALYGDNMQVGAAVFMGEKFAAHGEVSFSGATICGSFRCSRAGFDNRTPDGRARALVAIGAVLGDEVLFDGAKIEGRTNLNGAKIGGRLSFDGANIDNTTSDGNGVSLSAVGARTGGTMRFGKLGAHASTIGGRGNVFQSEGRINLTGATIGGDLVFQGSSLRNGTDNGSGIALSAKRLNVGGNVEFIDDFNSEGCVALAGATIGRDVRFSRAVLRNRSQSAVYAKDMRVGDDLHFSNTTAEGALCFRRIYVTGSVIWDKLALGSCHDDRSVPLDLRHARIGAVLNAKELSFVHPSFIDLCGARAGAIEHAWPQGWGSPHLGAPACRVNFDGLTYDRIMLDSTAMHMSPSTPVSRWHLISRIFGPWRDSLADKYGKWLGLQWKRTAGDDNEFFPQPYRQLARVLRNQGEEAAARDIAIAEQWATPKFGLLPRIARRAFGVGFGFGLRPRNAIATLVVFLLVGTIGVRIAKNDDMLVESIVVASTGAQIVPQDGMIASGAQDHLKRAVLRLDGGAAGPATEVSCTDAANTWTDDLVYAADMLVPFIPLHQEGKCEIVPRSDWRSGVWRSLKAVYSVTGWAIFSLALVTFSGLLKRFDRDAA